MALIGGLSLLMLTAISSWSIVGRAFYGHPLLGDYELVEAGTALAVFCFLPWCQLQGAHPRVTLFTQHLPSSLRASLDACAHLLMALLALVLAWRMLLGSVDFWQQHEQSMLLHLPLWWLLLIGSLSFLLTALVALQQCWQALNR